MNTTSLLNKLASFTVNTSLDQIPEDVKEWGREALADFTAVVMPGAKMPVSQNVMAYLKETMTPGKSVLFGTTLSTDPVSACLFNGTASHSLDFDDVSWATIGHPTVSVAPAAFAVAQETEGSGADVLKAYVIGVEVMHQIARWTMPKLSENGWHTTPAYGAFGAAAAACSLYKANETITANALAIAASKAGGVRANFGTQTKALHAGLSAAAGVEAAKLAIHGVTGNPAAIEAIDGFAQCFSNPIEANIKVDIGEFWDLRENGLVFKQYPCCSGSHPTNDVWNDYLEKNNLCFEDIEKIHAGVSLLGPRELNCHRPTDSVQAKFSLEYALASRIVLGPITVDSFTNEKVNDPRIQDLMNRIEMEIDPELAKLGFIGTAPVRLSIYLKNGEVINLSNDLAEGNPEKPLTEEKRRNKFFSCLKSCGQESLAQTWWKLFTEIESVSVRTVSTLGRIN